MDSLSESYSASMVKKVRDFLSSAVRSALLAGKCSSNPIEQVCVNRPVPAPTPHADISKIRETISLLHSGPALALGLMAGCEITIGEAAALRCADVSREEILIRERAARNHGGQQRLHRYQDPRRLRLQPWLAETIFRSQWGNVYVLSDSDLPCNVGTLDRSDRWLLMTLGFDLTLNQLSRLARGDCDA